MRKAQIIHIEQHSRVETQMTHFTLPSLLPPGQTLDLNLETQTLSLLTGGSVIKREQQLGVNEMCVFVPILESFPRYCPYEVLLARLSSNNPTEVSIECWQQRLQVAHTRGTWQQELR